MAVFAIGVAGVVYFATKPPVPGELKFEVNGMTVTADARRGGHMPPRDLQYVFDFDDGKLPVQQASPELSHTYSQPGTYKVKVQVKDPRWGTSDSVSKNVTVH
jgi:hypothetical protein